MRGSWCFCPLSTTPDAAWRPALPPHQWQPPLSSVFTHCHLLLSLDEEHDCRCNVSFTRPRPRMRIFVDSHSHHGRRSGPRGPARASVHSFHSVGRQRVAMAVVIAGVPWRSSAMATKTVKDEPPATEDCLVRNTPWENGRMQVSWEGSAGVRRGPNSNRGCPVW